MLAIFTQWNGSSKRVAPCRRRSYSCQHERHTGWGLRLTQRDLLEMGKGPPLPMKRDRGPSASWEQVAELIGELARGEWEPSIWPGTPVRPGSSACSQSRCCTSTSPEAAFVDMLRDEARIAARIHHPNVVAVVDLGTHGNSALRRDAGYVEGQWPSLPCGSAAPPSVRWSTSRTSIVIDTLEGLHAAHTLKDDDRRRNSPRAPRRVAAKYPDRRIDGVARITDFEASPRRRVESRSTRRRTRKGKLLFMSPEQITDSEAIDRRTDVWAMGVVLWTVLTGEHLFRADNDAATIHSVLVKDVPPPSKTDAKPPACFDDIILRALERDPAKRYSSALEMADALRQRATENSLLGSRQRIATWVEQMFGEELDRRRKGGSSRGRRMAPAKFGTPDLDRLLAGHVVADLCRLRSSTAMPAATAAALAAAAQPLPALGFANSSNPSQPESITLPAALGSFLRGGR